MGSGSVQLSLVNSILRRIPSTLLVATVRCKHKYPKNIRAKIDYSRVPNIDFAKEVEEKRVRGSGPGGQSVATSSNAVQLFHLPTGLTVKCHESRSVDRNREIAQEKLLTALDNHLNGDDSVEAQAGRIIQALHKFKKESARDKRETKLLARLKAKEEQFVEKIDFIKANLDQYTQPEEKIQQIEGELIDIRAKISKIEGEEEEDVSS